MKIDFNKKAEFEALLDKSINDCKKSIEANEDAMLTDTLYYSEYNAHNQSEKLQLKQLESISKAYYKITT